MLFLILPLTLAISPTCLYNSEKQAGTAQYTTSDLDQIVATEFNDHFRVAGVNTCLETTTQKLLGHQIAIADYSKIEESPSETDLIWLPGIGQT